MIVKGLVYFVAFGAVVSLRNACPVPWASDFCCNWLAGTSFPLAASVGLAGEFYFSQNGISPFYNYCSFEWLDCSRNYLVNSVVMTRLDGKPCISHLFPVHCFFLFSSKWFVHSTSYPEGSVLLTFVAGDFESAVPISGLKFFFGRTISGLKFSLTNNERQS